jgi:hypothetical protein
VSDITRRLSPVEVEVKVLLGRDVDGAAGADADVVVARTEARPFSLFACAPTVAADLQEGPPRGRMAGFGYGSGCEREKEREGTRSFLAPECPSSEQRVWRGAGNGSTRAADRCLWCPRGSDAGPGRSATSHCGVRVPSDRVEQMVVVEMCTALGRSRQIQVRVRLESERSAVAQPKMPRTSRSWLGARGRSGRCSRGLRQRRRLSWQSLLETGTTRSSWRRVVRGCLVDLTRTRLGGPARGGDWGESSSALTALGGTLGHDSAKPAPGTWPNSGSTWNSTAEADVGGVRTGG